MATTTVAPRAPGLIARALTLWPGLDRRALARTRGEPERIVKLVTRRTALPEESIEALLRNER